MITLFLSLWAIVPAANVYADRNGRKPNYIIMFILRGAAAILHAILFNPQNTIDWLPILIFQVTSFWILFELGLNMVRGNPLLYYDNFEGDSGILDRFFKWAGPTAHFVAKLAALILCVLSGIVIYHL